MGTRGARRKPIIRAMREKLPFFMLPDMDFGAKRLTANIRAPIS